MPSSESSNLSDPTTGSGTPRCGAGSRSRRWARCGAFEGGERDDHEPAEVPGFASGCSAGIPAIALVAAGSSGVGSSESTRVRFRVGFAHGAPAASNPRSARALRSTSASGSARSTSTSGRSAEFAHHDVADRASRQPLWCARAGGLDHRGGVLVRPAERGGEPRGVNSLPPPAPGLLVDPPGLAQGGGGDRGREQEPLDDLARGRQADPFPLARAARRTRSAAPPIPVSRATVRPVARAVATGSGSSATRSPEVIRWSVGCQVPVASTSDRWVCCALTRALPTGAPASATTTPTP